VLVSVVVRSYHRKAALLELVARLCQQGYPHFVRRVPRWDEAGGG
jgi:hypothetical protein